MEKTSLFTRFSSWESAACAAHENLNEDNFENVANVEMLPMPMLPVPIEIGNWDWQHWILATFDQVIGKKEYGGDEDVAVR